MNDLRLELNNDAVWTEKQVEYYKKHANSFRFTPDMVEEILGLILGGNAPTKCTSIIGENFYEIFVDDKMVGELKLTPYEDEDDVGEVDIAIYDEFQGKHYAEQAIQKFCGITNMNRIYGLVYDENDSKMVMNKIFAKLGFKDSKLLAETEWYKDIARKW